MEHQSENKICQNCKQDFTIESEDFNFYEKIKVPAPTFCAECRSQRRNAWRNNMSLYNAKCDLCDKSIITLYSPDSGLKIYCNKCWWSDKWDPKSYAVDYDFTKPFFIQYDELLKRVPQIAIVNDDGIASINCEYTHDWWFSKNCYMTFSGWHVENVMYSFFILKGKDIMDCANLMTESQWLYECTSSGTSFQLKYSHSCKACIDSQFLYDCTNCTNCFMCYGLQNKTYHFKNKQYTKEEYEKILSEYKLETFSGVKKAQKEYEEFILQHPRRSSVILKSVNCHGNIIFHSKNTKNSFVARDCENCKYSEFITKDKDSFDLAISGELSECYEGVVVDHSQLNRFGLFSVKSQDLHYTQHCHSSKYLFGCVSIRNSSYCILNKQYTKEEYEELVPKIIAQMNELSYINTKGVTYRYGEFFPIEFSPFGYNETVAMENFSLTKEQVLSQGYKWQDNTQRTIGKETLTIDKIPDSINEVAETITNEILSCMECSRNYKIVPNELIFYRKMQIPIPRRCFYCRHDLRTKRRNPSKLWHRKCMKQGCQNEFETSYAPERPEVVYCERCYQQEIY